jgi:hypothetical protein
MLASRFEATAFPNTMADDTMEISSEHGQNIGDGDIDIDIDFTAGHVDEDYVLEDAASNAGFGDDFQPQPSPAVGHDDLMVDEDEDEDEESYSMPMDGADFMREDDTHNVEDEVLTRSSAPQNISTVLVEESHSGDTSHLAADGSMNDEVSWEANDELEQVTNTADVSLEDAEEEHHENPLEDGHFQGDTLQGSTDAKEFAAPPPGTPHEDAYSDIPHDTSPKGNTVDEEPRNPPTSISAPKVESHGHRPGPANEASGITSGSNDIISTSDDAPTEQTASITSIHEVVVVYQDSEYSLFSKSETDDIDSYFLSDLSIMDKPLGDFFDAIRDVIRDDINDEEELCLSVEDLGLEIEEVSCISAFVAQAGLICIGQASSLIGDITIGQIIDLHEKLLKNDGVESLRPLCLLLGTRPNFSARFATLISGAVEGKGLSELVHWDEQSEGFDDSANVTENEHEEQLEQESHEVEEGLGDAAEKEETNGHQQEISSDTLAQEPITEQEPPYEAGDTQSDDAPGSAATNATSAAKGSAAEASSTEDALPVQNVDASASGEYDEDGDLIDYSDVEDEARPELRKDEKYHSTKLETDNNRTHNGTFTDFFSPCLKPNTCFCSKCNDLLLAEYEAINEDLRRRSISRAAEENLFEGAAEPSVVDEGENNDHETTLEAENGIEYDENEEDDPERGNLTAELTDPSADSGEGDAVEFGRREDEFFIEDGDADGGEVSEGHDPMSEPTNGAYQGTFDEFDFGEDDQPHDENLPLLTGQETQFHDEHVNPVDEQTAPLSKETFPVGSLDFTDAADSESAASEKTLEAQPVPIDDVATVLNEENEDEIDYDDDEELNVLEVQEPIMKELQPPNSSSGKRQRADDDVTSTGSKGISNLNVKRMRTY